MPKSHTDMVAAVFRTVFAQPDAEAVRHRGGTRSATSSAKSFPKIGPLMDDAKVEVLAFTAPRALTWQKIWSLPTPRTGQQGDPAAAPA